MPEQQHRARRALTAPRTPIVLPTRVLIISPIDRGTLVTAGPLITCELGLSLSRFGALLPALYLAYATLMIPAGWLAGRSGACPVLAVARTLALRHETDKAVSWPDSADFHQSPVRRDMNRPRRARFARRPPSHAA